MKHQPLEIKARGVILNDQGHILLCAMKWDQKHAWILPGGTSETPEAVRVTLEREIIEELGVRPTIGPLVFIQEFFRSGGEQVLDFWYCIENWQDFVHLENTTATHAFEYEKAEFCDLSQDAISVFPPILRECVALWKNEPHRLIIGEWLSSHATHTSTGPHS